MRNMRVRSLKKRKRFMTVPSGFTETIQMIPKGNGKSK